MVFALFNEERAFESLLCAMSEILLNNGRMIVLGYLETSNTVSNCQ